MWTILSYIFVFLVAYILGHYQKLKWFFHWIGRMEILGIVMISIIIHFFKTGRSLRSDIRKRDEEWYNKWKN